MRKAELTLLTVKSVGAEVTKTALKGRAHTEAQCATGKERDPNILEETAAEYSTAPRK